MGKWECCMNYINHGFKDSRAPCCHLSIDRDLVADTLDFIAWYQLYSGYSVSSMIKVALGLLSLVCKDFYEVGIWLGYWPNCHLNEIVYFYKFLAKLFITFILSLL